jgi:hypothetical protein
MSAEHFPIAPEHDNCFVLVTNRYPIAIPAFNSGAFSVQECLKI